MLDLLEGATKQDVVIATKGRVIDQAGSDDIHRVLVSTKPRPTQTTR